MRCQELSFPRCREHQASLNFSLWAYLFECFYNKNVKELDIKVCPPVITQQHYFLVLILPTPPHSAPTRNMTASHLHCFFQVQEKLRSSFWFQCSQKVGLLEEEMDPSGLEKERAELPVLTWYRIQAMWVVGSHRGVKKRNATNVSEQTSTDGPNAICRFSLGRGLRICPQSLPHS